MSADTVISSRGLPKTFFLPGTVYAYSYSVLSIGIVFALIYAASLTNSIPLFVLLCLLVGLFQYRLSIVLHDCAHYSLFDKKEINILVGNIAAAMLFTTFTNFRTGHYAHHKFYKTDSDPSLPDYEIEPKSKLDVIWFMLQPLVGYAVFVKLGQFFNIQKSQANTTNTTTGKTPLKEFVILGLVQLLLYLLASAGLKEPVRWVFLVFLPAATIVLLLSRVRTFLEHGGLNEDHDHDDLTPPRNCGRNTISARLERFVLSPMNFNYHFWHHKYPGIPSSNLPKLHNWYLVEHPEFFRDETNEEVHSDSFFATFKRFLNSFENWK